MVHGSRWTRRWITGGEGAERYTKTSEMQSQQQGLEQNLQTPQPQKIQTESEIDTDRARDRYRQIYIERHI